MDWKSVLRAVRVCSLGISQRDYTQYYHHISKQEAQICHSIQEFFSQHVQYQFLDEDCELDSVWCDNLKYIVIRVMQYVFCFTVVLDVYRDSWVSLLSFIFPAIISCLGLVVAKAFL